MSCSLLVLSGTVLLNSVLYSLRHRSHSDVEAWLFTIRVYMGMTRGPPLAHRRTVRQLTEQSPSI